MRQRSRGSGEVVYLGVLCLPGSLSCNSAVGLASAWRYGVYR
ncbi:MAG: hypothetical protein ACPL3C_07590 [Pyrobaculum sp.]|uniref:Uncharacterized protein n=1 Tax=Pyrobaculum ferrireducens TaxID=1104324 RepID=G7VHB1_9CREN|nr:MULTISPECIES: hypothetical protein [Pyrobaculum]AET32014.1 hypothetical protein P186_0562 [Pyrobaculum ferrireducens]MCU7786584.1 hypothetical protein [Pyrobaculum sp. 3827-6]